MTSIHQLAHVDALNGPAVCVRVLLRLSDVHVVRSPLHGRVTDVRVQPGRRLAAINPQHLEENHAVTLHLTHPARGTPLATLRLVAGMVMRTIVCHAQPQQILQRGQRLGLIKLGSTVELYLPLALGPQVAVAIGQRVRAAETVIAYLQPNRDGEA